MRKQEIIKQAYGENWELVKNSISENGWAKAELLYHLYSKNGLHKNFEQSGADRSKGFGPPVFYVRPKSLEGIEDNNGWIKIESEEDLPKHEGNFIPYHNLEYPKTTEAFSKNIIKKLFEYKKITHYKPIEQPKPPIY